MNIIFVVFMSIKTYLYLIYVSDYLKVHKINVLRVFKMKHPTRLN